MLSAYNASVMFLLHFYQSIMLCYNVIILANQVSGLFDQRYLKTEYTYTILIFFHKKHTENFFDVKFDNSQDMQKMSEKWEQPSF